MTTTQVRYWELQESERHNLATERLTASQIRESVRHNKVTESQGWSGLKLEGLKLKETTRHNVVTERETQRHNEANERLTATQIAESIRHNKATESLTASQINEMRRHNVELEKQGKVDLINRIRQTNASITRMQAQTAIEQSIARYQNQLNAAKTNEARTKAINNIANSITSILGMGSSASSSLIPLIIGLI